jgi:hypothetical protein
MIEPDDSVCVFDIKNFSLKQDKLSLSQTEETDEPLAISKFDRYYAKTADSLDHRSPLRNLGIIVRITKQDYKGRDRSNSLISSVVKPGEMMQLDPSMHLDILHLIFAIFCNLLQSFAIFVLSIA